MYYELWLLLLLLLLLFNTRITKLSVYFGWFARKNVCYIEFSITRNHGKKKIYSSCLYGEHCNFIIFKTYNTYIHSRYLPIGVCLLYISVDLYKHNIDSVVTKPFRKSHTLHMLLCLTTIGNSRNDRVVLNWISR